MKWLILFPVVIYIYFGLNSVYKRQVNKLIKPTSDQLVTTSDLDGLPDQVAAYLRYVGVVGKPRVHSFKAKISGQMRLDQGKAWCKISGKQYNHFLDRVRLFYMTMTYKGLKMTGLHHFKDGHASMVVRLLDLIKVVDESGDKMKRAETVTYFNDMLVFAPGALLDAAIIWQDLDEKVQASFTLDGITVEAVLTFDNARLVNFESHDRMMVEDGLCKAYPWSTPISEYKEINGYNLPYKGQAIWHLPEGDFSYFKMTIDHVAYNK